MHCFSKKNSSPKGNFIIPVQRLFCWHNYKTTAFNQGRKKTSNEPAITPHQSSTIKKQECLTACNYSTSYKHSACDRFKKLECSVHKQNDISLGFCYRGLKYGPLETDNELLIQISFLLIDNSIAVCWRSCSFQVTQWVSLIRIFFS